MAQACYGSRWALPVAAMLLSLKPRKHNDSVILGGFRSMFDDGEINSLDISGMKFDSESERMPELKLYKDIMSALHAFAQGHDTEQLGERFAHLSVVG
ncbi:hypothetical protein VTI28DRAFT_10458 [Corynascus sepedonium]